MKIHSWEHYGIDPARMLALGATISAGLGITMYLLTRDVLGSGSPEISVLISMIVLYLVLSSPKRLLESAALSQAREATTLAAAGSANFDATHSRSKSVLMLESGDIVISNLLSDVKRKLLLGFGVPESMAVAENRIASFSARNVLRSIALMDPRLMDERGEETQAITQSSQLSEESKLPLFMAVAFFTPIMLTLFAILTHLDDPKSFAELIFVQLVIMDITFNFSSAERRRLS